MTLIESTVLPIRDSSGALATGRVWFEQTDQYATANGVVTTTRGFLNVTDGIITAADGGPANVPATPDGQVTWLYHEFGGTTGSFQSTGAVKWAAIIPDVSGIEYADLLPGVVPPSVGVGVPPWAAELLTARDEAVAAADAAVLAQAAAELARDEAVAAAAGGGGGGGVVVSDSPSKPLEGKTATYWVSSAVTWPTGLVWSSDPDGGSAPTISSRALVSLVTIAGVTYAVAGSTFDVPAGPDVTPPSQVTGLVATPASTSVALSWTASTDNVGVTGYEYRIGSGSWVDAGAGLSENVGGLTASTSYTFEVRAYDAAGNKGAAGSVSTTTTAAALTPFLSYSFSEGSGPTAAEGSGKQALDINGAAWTASGHTGPGITSNSTSIGASKTFSPAGVYPVSSWAGFTFGGWIKGGVAGAQIAIVIGGVEYFIGVKDNEFVVGLGGPTANGTQGSFDVDVWHHFAVAVTFTGGTSDPYTLFFDGVAAGTGTGDYPHVDALDSLLVGSRFAGTTSIIDGVRVYDKALTAGEVVAWMGAT